MPELGSGLYTGFILPNQTTTPYQVWVPCFDGFFSLGSFKNIGKNMLSSITTSVLEEMRQKCSYYHITQELSPGNFRFNEAMGAGTTEEFTPKDLRDTNLPDLSRVQTSKTSTTARQAVNVSSQLMVDLATTLPKTSCSNWKAVLASIRCQVCLLVNS